MYKDNFKEIVDLSVSEDLYIGMGNPNANLLIIGKELALDEDSQNPVIVKTNLQNAKDWRANINNPQMLIPNCENNSQITDFNPLYPYKGMKKKCQPFGHTWRKYQLLYECTTDSQSDEYTFYQGSFITELNQTPSKYSAIQINKIRANSIKKRVDLFFTSDFIQNFPIVIVACGHYPKENGVDLCEIFKVDFKSPTIHVDDDPKQWYNLHYSKDKDRPKMLIHTRQLSMNVSNNLIKMISNEIANFCKEYKIEI